MSLYDKCTGRAFTGNGGKAFVVEPKNILVAMSTAGAYLLTKATVDVLIADCRRQWDDVGNLTTFGKAPNDAKNAVNVTSKTTPVILNL